MVKFGGRVLLCAFLVLFASIAAQVEEPRVLEDLDEVMPEAEELERMWGPTGIPEGEGESLFEEYKPVSAMCSCNKRHQFDEANLPRRPAMTPSNGFYDRQNYSISPTMVPWISERPQNQLGPFDYQYNENYRGPTMVPFDGFFDHRQNYPTNPLGPLAFHYSGNYPSHAMVPFNGFFDHRQNYPTNQLGPFAFHYNQNYPRPTMVPLNGFFDHRQNYPTNHLGPFAFHKRRNYPSHTMVPFNGFFDHRQNLLTNRQGPQNGLGHFDLSNMLKSVVHQTPSKQSAPSVFNIRFGPSSDHSAALMEGPVVSPELSSQDETSFAPISKPIAANMATGHFGNREEILLGKPQNRLPWFGNQGNYRALYRPWQQRISSSQLVLPPSAAMRPRRCRIPTAGSAATPTGGNKIEK